MTLTGFRIVCIFLLLSLLASNAVAVEPFSKEELEKLDARVQEIYEREGGARSKDEIWDEMKKSMMEPRDETNKLGLDFQPHKLNYFITNGFLGDPAAQVKFQISAKYGGIGTSEFRKYVPLYFAYTQKSFWDIGKPSAPFEENNYNPEIFLDYPIPENRLKLKHVVLGGEHESNGRDGAESRSWNRLYLLFSFAIDTKKVLEQKGVLSADKYSAYLKVWEAYGYEDQDDFLKSLGSDKRFLDYAGRGELGLSIRDLPLISKIALLKNNQLDFKTRIFRDWDKGSWEIGYHQNIPATNFFVYVQYWDGYGESLQRFSERDTKWKAGLSFFF